MIGRRGFFGFFAGAVASGPAIAKVVVTEAPAVMPVLTGDVSCAAFSDKFMVITADGLPIMSAKDGKLAIRVDMFADGVITGTVVSS